MLTTKHHNILIRLGVSYTMSASRIIEKGTVEMYDDDILMNFVDGY